MYLFSFNPESFVVNSFSFTYVAKPDCKMENFLLTANFSIMISLYKKKHLWKSAQIGPRPNVNKILDLPTSHLARRKEMTCSEQLLIDYS